MASYILIEAATTPKKKYEKKYKCCYCEERLTRPQLPSHIQKKHEDMIPEGHTALRVAFNIVNKKTEGHCIICEQVTAWNEQKGRYERLCGREACKKAYAAMAHKRVKDVLGTDCVLRDPRYKEEMLKKMLANRKISGTYKFSDGGTLGYTGTYERKVLEFMDKIMHIESTDILSPGPSIQYRYNGEDHMYISDFLYVPYNLIIEVKDGGSNPNNRPMEEYRQKQIAKEDAVRSDGTYNYLRLTNNEFSQLMEVMAVLKYTLAEDPEQRIVKVNESVVFNENDIYYNKHKFDSGETNLCFITGHSGSGKSTMGKGMQGNNVEHYELDDLYCVKDHFSMDNLKEYGNLIYSYFNGPGKKFYLSKEDIKEQNLSVSDYDDKLWVDFVHYAMKYAKSHKNVKYVIEGVWFFSTDRNGKPWFTPNEFKDYAFYIKGTSIIISKHRAALRDAKNNNKTKLGTAVSYAKDFIGTDWKWYFVSDKNINIFRSYFSKIVNENMQGVIGAAIVPSIKKGSDNVYMVQNLQNNVFAYGITKDPTQNEIIGVDAEKGYVVSKMNKKDIPGSYITFKMRNRKKAEEVYEEAVKLAKMGAKVDDTEYFYRKYTGMNILSDDQIAFDEAFIPIENFDDELKRESKLLESYIMNGNNPYMVLEQQIDKLEGLINADY